MEYTVCYKIHKGMNGYCPPKDFLSQKGIHGSGENRDVLFETNQWSYKGMV
jgi:hypothetical protein